MSYRFLAIAIFVGTALAPQILMGQGAENAVAPKGAPTTKAWVPSRTPDGQPDLEGIFTNATVTPLERPRELGGKEFFTPDEAAAYAKKVLEQPELTGPGTYADVHYNTTQFGLTKVQAKVSTTVRTSLIVGPEGRVPPMLPEAQKRVAARAALNKGHEFDGPENRPLEERCILWPNEGPPMLPATYNSNVQIVQGRGYVAILQEMIHDVRVIPTDGSPHLPASVHQLRGDSRGHWEGNTLVVDTTNFTDRTAFRGSSENLHVVERFTRTAPDTILYQFTVSDPLTWEKSWSGEIPMITTDGPIFEYACHEGNYGEPNTLRGARVKEKAATENKAAAESAK